MHVKLQKIGDTLGIILPREALDQLKGAEGTVLELTTSGHGEITLSVSEDSEEMRIGKDIMRRYDKTLKALAM